MTYTQLELDLESVCNGTLHTLGKVDRSKFHVELTTDDTGAAYSRFVIPRQRGAGEHS